LIVKMKQMAVAVGGALASAGAFAQTGGGSSDPTPSIVSQLGTYATDVGLLAVAVLAIVYGKKLVGYLRV
jgi:hypothetical protein